MIWLPVILILPYFILLLVIYRNLLRLKPFALKSTGSTAVSVIIACKNEEERLPSLLESINNQDYPKELLEVIIVDDNSDDHTFIAASSYKGSPDISVLKNSGKGKKEALRTGIAASSGKLIITTDADCTMGRSWIRSVVSFFEEKKSDMVICPVQIAGEGSFFQKFQQLEFLGLQGITAGTAVAGNAILCNGANLCFNREAYFRHFNELHPELSTGDDIFLLHSLKKESDSRIMWLESRDAMVSTPASPTPGSFLRQRRRWISKWSFYNDRLTLITGLFTFTAVVIQMLLTALLFLDFSFAWPWLVVILLKSIPDFLIISNTASRYGQSGILQWFLPVQLIYPVYVLVVFLASLFRGPERNF